MKYIIQPGFQITNPENKNINVLTSEQIKNYRDAGYKYRKQIYPMTIGHIDYEVICVEIWQKGDEEHSLVIPSFFIPHRGYAADVYEFAINLYSSNPHLSQRAVAEQTRIKYGLKTFAHTTVGRAMKALVKALMEIGAKDDTAPEGAVAPKQIESNADIKQKGRFPSLQDTKAQRDTIGSFINGKVISFNGQKITGARDAIHLLAYAFLPILMDLHHVSAVN